MNLRTWKWNCTLCDFQTKQIQRGSSYLGKSPQEQNWYSYLPLCQCHISVLRTLESARRRSENLLHSFSTLWHYPHFHSIPHCCVLAPTWAEMSCSNKRHINYQKSMQTTCHGPAPTLSLVPPPLLAFSQPPVWEETPCWCRGHTCHQFSRSNLGKGTSIQP